MADLLLELLSEEIPARMQAQACEDIKKRMSDAFAAQTLTFATMEAYATPRRLALHVTGLPLAQEDVHEELKGPRTDAPEQALAGFLKKTGLTQEQLDVRDDSKKGQVYFAVIARKGRATADVVAELVPDIVRKFPWPKSMRWGAASRSTESLRWVRPLQSIVCLLDGIIVPFEIDGIKSSNVTRGHRFMSMSQFSVNSFDEYETKLRENKVILNPAERMEKIAAQARTLAEEAGLTLADDTGLLAENAGLTEWPVALMGSFDSAFLDVPAECLTATMRANQKYFSLRGRDGKMANRFICTANLEAKDGGKLIIAGNQKVLSARLSDAKFFWDQDRKKRLEDYLPKLADIVFHEKLGTVAEKVARVEKLAKHLARELYPQLCLPGKSTDPATGDFLDTGYRKYPTEQSFVDTVAQAARLCKADLVTGMVGEFPELQGIMGRYYASGEGLPSDVAHAIEEHYKPQGQNDTVPGNPVSICVALADKIDTLTSFFAINEKPTGSRDPFALRRAGLGLIQLILTLRLRYRIPADLLDFIVDRLKVQQREQGVRHDVIDAVFALGDDDIVRLLARVKALQAFLGTDDGTNLLAGYRRAANILKIEEKKDGATYALDLDTLDTTYIGETEKNLARVFAEGVFMEIDALLQHENFDAAMSALARLRAPVDAFFNDVMVNDPDPAVRVHRLQLLAGVRDAMHKVADFSKIEG
jgi:glycyl-tRNA synthetase beta chain